MSWISTTDVFYATKRASTQITKHFSNILWCGVVWTQAEMWLLYFLSFSSLSLNCESQLNWMHWIPLLFALYHITYVRIVQLLEATQCNFENWIKINNSPKASKKTTKHDHFRWTFFICHSDFKSLIYFQAKWQSQIENKLQFIEIKLFIGFSRFNHFQNFVKDQFPCVNAIQEIAMIECLVWNQIIQNNVW